MKSFALQPFPRTDWERGVSTYGAANQGNTPGTSKGLLTQSIAQLIVKTACFYWQSHKINPFVKDKIKALR